MLALTELHTALLGYPVIFAGIAFFIWYHDRKGTRL